MMVTKVTEKWVKTQVTNYLKAKNLYYFYPVASGYMSAGIPDIIVCVQGRFVGIECKAGKNKPTVIQERNIAAIQLNGGVAMVINENNLDHMRMVIDELTQD